MSLPSGSVFRSLYESCKVYGKYTFEYVNSSDYIRKPLEKAEGEGGKKVRCIETGRIFANGKEAEKELGLYDTAVYNSIYMKYPVKGYSFEYLDPSDYTHTPHSYVPHSPGSRVKVKCLENGKEYNSYAEARRDTGVSESSIANSIRQHRSAKGMTFIEI